MDDKSYVVRVPKRWVRIALVVGITTLVVAPLTAVATHSFTDVPDSNTFHDDIAWLADADVTRGCNPPDNTEFCPDDEVTREQMAAFMRRFAQYMGAEDGTPAQADNATTADHAGTADNAATADDAATLDGYGLANFIGAEMTVRRDSVEVNDGGTGTAFAQCESGEVLIGGGGNLSAFTFDGNWLSSRPSPNTEGATPVAWQASASNPLGGTGTFEVRALAICASFPDVPLASVAEQPTAEIETNEP